MQRIKKETASGNVIIDRVLAAAWSDSEGRYEGDLYYGLIDNDNRTALINSFIKEQRGLCCYCLKEIKPEDVCIEHIIPQGVEHADFCKYLTVQELSDWLIHRDLFERRDRTIPPKRYPHDLGYNNLIASCKSSTHCNNKRGKEFITPFMYDNEEVKNIFYEPTGSCFTVTVNIEPLMLNNDFLKMIRRLWYLISKKIQSISSINTVEKLQLIVNEVVANEDVIYIETFSGEASKVSELFLYKWFFNYFLSYPR